MINLNIECEGTRAPSRRISLLNIFEFTWSPVNVNKDHGVHQMRLLSSLIDCCCCYCSFGREGGCTVKAALRFVIPSPFLAFLMTFWRFPATFRHLLATISHEFIQLVKCEYIELQRTYTCTIQACEVVSRVGQYGNNYWGIFSNKIFSPPSTYPRRKAGDIPLPMTIKVVIYSSLAQPVSELACGNQNMA